MSVSKNILERANRVIRNARLPVLPKAFARPLPNRRKPCQDWAGGRSGSPVRMRADFNMTVSAQYGTVSDFHNRWTRRFITAFAATVLCACSAMKVGYQQGDRLAYWWIDHYVDVSATQEPSTREAIARFFAWHRKAQLPEISALLTQAKSQVQQPLTPAMVGQFQDASQRLARQSFEYAMPDLADLLLTLTPEQIARMDKKFTEGNTKYRKKFLSGDAGEREDARYDKVMDYAKLIYGRFSDEQTKAIRAAVAPVVRGADARYAERIRRQQEWLALARQVQAAHPPKAQVLDMLRRYGEHWQNPPGKARAASYEANNEAGIALTVTIANLTTPTQKAHAAERFQKWIDDTQALIHEKHDGAAQAAVSY